jgi:glycine/D-amino acid oxidase-like deaminating enzyme
MGTKGHIVVLGAGVIGLAIAGNLAEAGYVVTVIAAHVPGDESIEYTSPW